MNLLKVVSSAAILALVLLVWAPTGVESECCYPDFKGYCADGSTKKPGKLFCGKGDCNMFGCNCDNGCFKRIDDRKARSVDDAVNGNAVNVTGHDVVRWADVNGDGALDAIEVKVYLTRSGVATLGDAWRSLDVDADGKLTPSEIDVDA